MRVASITPFLKPVARAAISVCVAYPLACVVVPLFVLPFYDIAYLSRSILSFGIAPMAYAYELASSFGSMETCGWLSGNCSRHDYRGTLIATWASVSVALFVGAHWVGVRPRPAARTT
jgi:hypothetical protein